MPGRKGRRPQRPRAHVVADRALTVFRMATPEEWVLYESRRDYGWDILVTISQSGEVREEFFVQLKGSDTPAYIAQGAKISQPLKVSTVRWLLEDKILPTMLCICDTSRKEEERVYWVWLKQAIEEVEARKANWQEQCMITLHIPTSHILSAECHEELESYVQDSYKLLYINQRITQIVRASIGDDPSCFPSKPPAEFLEQGVFPVLSEVRLIELVEEGDRSEALPISPRDRERERELDEASGLLKRFQDREVKRIMEHLADEIQEASDGTKARYYNALGILSLHEDNDSAAREHFGEAVALRPYIAKYRVNLLAVQYRLALARKDVELPPTWERELHDVLKQDPDFGPAVRLKGYWLGSTRSPQDAASFLQSSAAWEIEQLQARVCLAEIYRNADNLASAVEILEETLRLETSFDEIFWEIYGEIYFRMALSEATGGPSQVLRGFGPSQLDLPSLNKAMTGYRNALTIFEEMGYPSIAGPAVANYAAVVGLLGRLGEADQACETYLKRHPDNPQVRTALTCSLIQQDEVREATRHARIAFGVNADSPVAFTNLLLLLERTEEHEELLQLVKRRDMDGFNDKTEEGLSRTLAALAYCHLGEESLARDQLSVMKEDQDLSTDAVIADAGMRCLAGGSDEAILGLYREALSKEADNERLLTHFVLQFPRVILENAEELTAALRRIAKLRQLTPEEWTTLGRGYILLGKGETAEQVFLQATRRYPTHPTFLYERAVALIELGDEESAFAVLEMYLCHGELNDAALRGAAAIAANTGRLDNAVKLFQKALGRAKTPRERGDIHLQLYELKRRRGDPPKDILRHVVEYGKTINGDVEGEARFLILFLMATIQIPVADVDQDMRKWIEEHNSRLDQFCSAHPNFQHLKRWTDPAGLTDEEKAQHMLVAITSELLPWYLHTTPFRISARNVPYPLVIRAQYLPTAGSLFDLWNTCMRSRDFIHGVHIWSPELDLNGESQCGRKARQVCVDLSALLTLAELDLLTEFGESFDLIILALGSRQALEWEIHGYKEPQDIARRIEEWRFATRRRIRVRHGIGEELAKDRAPIEVSLPCGFGETLLLARRDELTLYSDDAIIRKWARDDCGLETFSTLALLDRLRQQGVMSQSRQIYVLAEMIRKNFRIVPIAPEHLTFRLNEILIEKRRAGEGIPRRDELVEDEVLGAMLSCFGDTSLPYPFLVNLAVDWWISIMEEIGDGEEILAECMQPPSFGLSMWTEGGILSGLHPREQHGKYAALWAFFLLRVFRQKRGSISKAWGGVKSSCEALFCRDEDAYNQIVYELIPTWLGQIIEKDRTLSDEQKVSTLVMLPMELPETDRKRFEAWLSVHKPRFLA